MVILTGKRVHLCSVPHTTLPVPWGDIKGQPSLRGRTSELGFWRPELSPHALPKCLSF